MSNDFIISFCTEGLEAVVPITELMQNHIMDTLAGRQTPKTVNQILNMMILRAQFNAQREYEIYFLSAVEGITEADIREMFELSPQTAADIIRDKGSMVFPASGYRKKKPQQVIF